jgi:hypothetical protein
MNQNDFSDFHALLEDCMAMWGGQPNAKVAAMWFGCLSAHSVDEVRWRLSITCETRLMANLSLSQHTLSSS